METGDYLLWVDKVEEPVGQDVLNNEAQLSGDLFGHGLSRAKLVTNSVVTTGGGLSHDNDGFSRVRSCRMLTSWCVMWGQVGDDIHEGGPAQAEGLNPLFIIPHAQDDLLPLVSTGGMGPEVEFDGLKVVPEYPIIHGVSGGLILIDYMKISSLVHDPFRVKGVVGGPVRDSQLLALGHEVNGMVTSCHIMSRWACMRSHSIQ
ncbi:hypothetical protein Y1Q_0010694 [Alligator mississippiensis]|uniref:Uncharacterized protein n=1 Tax=Alligator mississippiensis TaxID=8496 RepID=A0A151M6I7_ALLMI|nr:hypothetical protein Y1Q_0010694 [Alligator mississippiensis]